MLYHPTAEDAASGRCAPRPPFSPTPGGGGGPGDCPALQSAAGKERPSPLTTCEWAMLLRTALHDRPRPPPYPHPCTRPGSPADSLSGQLHWGPRAAPAWKAGEPLAPRPGRTPFHFFSADARAKVGCRSMQGESTWWPPVMAAALRSTQLGCGLAPRSTGRQAAGEHASGSRLASVAAAGCGRRSADRTLPPLLAAAAVREAAVPAGQRAAPQGRRDVAAGGRCGTRALRGAGAAGQDQVQCALMGDGAGGGGGDCRWSCRHAAFACIIMATSRLQRPTSATSVRACPPAAAACRHQAELEAFNYRLAAQAAEAQALQAAQAVAAAAAALSDGPCGVLGAGVGWS
jgi:hypothetical protein